MSLCGRAREIGGRGGAIRGAGRPRPRLYPVAVPAKRQPPPTPSAREGRRDDWAVEARKGQRPLQVRAGRRVAGLVVDDVERVADAE